VKNSFPYRLAIFACFLACFLACFVATSAVAQVRQQDKPPEQRQVSECLAMAQALPGARYASLDNALPLIRVAASRSEVTITYVGHSTYVIDTASGVRIATDYSGYYRAPGRLPDVVTMNRAHSSHYTLNPDPGIKHVLHGWGDNGEAARHEIVVGDVLIRNVTTDIRFGFGSFDNRGAPMQRDGNSIFIFEVAGLCIGHLGHLHHRLEDVHISEIGRLDIVMVPIDGGLTMSLDGMSELVKRLRSSVVLPMHRQGIPVEDFMSRMRAQFEIDRRTERSLTISRETLPKTPTIVILDGV
jgi:L-ascorbate metabolism protein UlaG (beta-lactamase superfamily)